MTAARRPTVGVALALGLLAGCTSGTPEPTPTSTATGAPTVLETPDADAIALSARVADLRRTVTALRAELETAATGDRAALARAGDLLAADVEGAIAAGVELAERVASTETEPVVTPGEPAASRTGVPADPEAADASAGPDDPSASAAPDEEPAPLLPGPDVSRAETVVYGDLLTRLLAASRSAGGTGEPVARFLADPFAGDLGAWQRSPSDQLAVIAVAGATMGLDRAESAILDLTGEAPRALGWVLHGLAHPEQTADAANRALAHLAVIEIALEQL